MKRTATVLAVLVVGFCSVPAHAGDRMGRLVEGLAAAAIVGMGGEAGYAPSQASRGYYPAYADDGYRSYASMAPSLATRYGRSRVVRCGRNAECAELVEEIVASYPRREGVRRLDALYSGF